MNLNLAGKVAVVVGAAGEIGLAIARAFAQEDSHVAMLDLSERVHTLASDVGQETSSRVLARQVDAADQSAMQAGADWVVSTLGRCDHVLVTVGVGSGKFGNPFWQLEPKDWVRVWQVNLMSCVNAAYVFTPHMLPARCGSFLFLSSVAGQIGSPTDPPYSAAKAAVLNFTRCAAQDLAPYAIRVNAICPGMVKSDLNRSVWQAWSSRVPAEAQLDYESWAAEKIARVAPLGQWQRPEEIAAMATFLASDYGVNITGQTVNIDGGQVMH